MVPAKSTQISKENHVTIHVYIYGYFKMATACLQICIKLLARNEILPHLTMISQHQCKTTVNKLLVAEQGCLIAILNTKSTEFKWHFCEGVGEQKFKTHAKQHL